MWTKGHRINCSYHGPRHPEVVDLIQQLEWPFEDAVAMPARRQHFAEFGQDSPGICMCSDLASNKRCCFSHIQYSLVQESKGKNGRGTTTATSSDQLAKFGLPVPKTLDSVGLDILMPGRNASTRRHTGDSIDMEAESATWLLWAPH